MDKKMKMTGLLLASLCWGCVHNLEITNLDDYRPQGNATMQRKASVRVENRTETESARLLCKQIQTELSRRGCAAGYSEQPEYLVYLDVNVKKSANGSNFFVSWPGYMIFTHAWLGYGYDVEYMFNCEIVKPATGLSVGDVREPVELHIRYADFGTTWGAGCGWIPYIGLITSVANGCYVMSTYDEDITPGLREEGYPVLAEFIADRLIEKMNKR